jgi:hypothetical protein
MKQYHESISLDIINDIKSKIANEPKSVKAPPILMLAFYRSMPKFLQKVMKAKIIKAEQLYFCGSEFLIDRDQTISLKVFSEDKYKLNDLKKCKQVIDRLISETKTFSVIIFLLFGVTLMSMVIYIAMIFFYSQRDIHDAIIIRSWTLIIIIEAFIKRFCDIQIVDQEKLIRIVEGAIQEKDRDTRQVHNNL